MQYLGNHLIKLDTVFSINFLATNAIKILLSTDLHKLPLSPNIGLVFLDVFLSAYMRYLLTDIVFIVDEDPSRPTLICPFNHVIKCFKR